MDTPSESTWIAETADGVVVARLHAGKLLVDRPSLGTFRETESPAFEDGHLVLDGVLFRPVTPLPIRLAEMTGWYAGGARRIVLTQIPEAYFGEPMILVAEDDRVTRAYALAEDRLLTEAGESIDLTDDGRLRVTTGGHVDTLARAKQYRERDVTFTAGDVPLAGTLILPPGPGPHAAAVLLHGAAGGQRDFCRLHADPILAAGVAVLLYDKAGHGLSGGTSPPSSIRPMRRGRHADARGSAGDRRGSDRAGGLLQRDVGGPDDRRPVWRSLPHRRWLSWCVDGRVGGPPPDQGAT